MDILGYIIVVSTIIAIDSLIICCATDFDITPIVWIFIISISVTLDACILIMILGAL